MSQVLEIDVLTAIFRLLSDETRLRILSALNGNELAVGELQKILNLGQSTLSTQLGLLKDQNLVISKKEGQKVYYRLPGELNTEGQYSIIQNALKSAQTSKWFERDGRQLKKILQERAEASLQFFNSLAHQNKPSPGQTWKALSLGLIQLLRGQRIVDLGCGNGRLAAQLAKAGNFVTAVDNSEEQIRLAIQSVGESPNLHFIQATMENSALPKQSFDIALLSQSLHHAAKPQEVLAESYRLLIPGGRLLILDLLAHAEEWMQTKFGDFWLGFSLNDLENWLKQIGFQNIHSEITGSTKDFPEIESLLVTAEKPIT